MAPTLSAALVRSQPNRLGIAEQRHYALPGGALLVAMYRLHNLPLTVLGTPSLSGVDWRDIVADSSRRW